VTSAVEVLAAGDESGRPGVMSLDDEAHPEGSETGSGVTSGVTSSFADSATIDGAISASGIRPVKWP
jgi:hypothetical protein